MSITKTIFEVLRIEQITTPIHPSGLTVEALEDWIEELQLDEEAQGVWDEQNHIYYMECCL